MISIMRLDYQLATPYEERVAKIHDPYNRRPEGSGGSRISIYLLNWDPFIAP